MFYRRLISISSELVAGGILPHLAAHLSAPCSPDRLPVVSEVAWVLTYLAATGDHTAAILSAGLLTRLTALIVEVSKADVDNFHVGGHRTDVDNFISMLNVTGG